MQPAKDIPSGPVRLALCERALISPDSLRRVFRGLGSPNMRARVFRACTELGISPPALGLPPHIAPQAGPAKRPRQRKVAAQCPQM